MAIAVTCALGCGSTRRPVILEPDQLVPPAPGLVWEDPSPEEVQNAESAAPVASLPSGQQDLGNLIDLALLRNPNTRRVWENARAAAARVARAEGAYFPEFGVGVEGGYGRFLIQN